VLSTTDETEKTNYNSSNMGSQAKIKSSVLNVVFGWLIGSFGKYKKKKI